MNQKVQRILIYGNTIAASYTALALDVALDTSIDIVLVEPKASACNDILYGGIAPPNFYDFHFKLGVSEPDLLLKTNTGFSFGTEYKSWGPSLRNWIQCYHLPFATDHGVDFHQLVNRLDLNMGEYLVSAVAAKHGVFAHPPTNNSNNALSRAEYGYHFNAQRLKALLREKLNHRRVNVMQATIVDVKTGEQHIKEVRLDNGSVVNAQLFIDCHGPDSPLLTALAGEFEHQHAKQYIHHVEQNRVIGAACRVAQATSNGYQVEWSLQVERHVIELAEQFDVGSPKHAWAKSITVGHRNCAWHGNCIGIGHSVCVAEPLTDAPMRLLHADILRLMELFPIDVDMAVERKEFNRRYQNDVESSLLFHQAFFDYRTDGKTLATKLDRKISQYLHRGVLVSFDLELFNKEDWAVQHAGMGRTPMFHDRLVDELDLALVDEHFKQQKAGLRHLVSKMPTHADYLHKLLIYLRNKQF
ncbi:tryptophan 7-halogenase [Alteromonas sp. KUL49]|uniref:tryptophan 7-halogenase n=1 Tax=Alteromonas sp. KUL49 TaxID=2480798 RepID=UPI00102EF22D|nr:tryptophan 7-halogenase [Alteromonas sp. KUL49]TAP42286.1 hypothetical protein EYS00_01325 [Alteromonas sp. KUL49]GEA09892.1 tryptophan halogenase [Alteromonas sp. KUL49]